MNIQKRISGFVKFIFEDSRMAWLWLAVRLYVGWTWLEAGWEKLHSSAWTGLDAGTALHGFIQGGLQKASGPHPDVQNWYAFFLRNFVDHHTVIFSYMVSYGELLVGISLILGLFTLVGAFFGAFMNFNYLLAGTVSVNPILLVLEIGILIAWKISGKIGLDKFKPLTLLSKNSII